MESAHQAVTLNTEQANYNHNRQFQLEIGHALRKTGRLAIILLEKFINSFATILSFMPIIFIIGTFMPQ
jgi:hypothetical protein